MKKDLFIRLLVFMIVALNSLNAQFVHPGLSHKLSDLDRMKYMVEAGIEPFTSSFQLLAAHPRAQYDIEVAGGNTGMTELNAQWKNYLKNDGITAYYNALMWYITGDSRHAEKAIEVFNAYSDLKRNTTGIPLESGRHWKLIEAAEIIKSTYSAWDPNDLQKFKDMLVYPGYSSTTEPTAAISNGDYTLYWHCYQGDPARHGNQGIFCMRMVMAMGVFLDNEIMYYRALRYLQGNTHRSDDLAYPSGPPIIYATPKAVYEHFEEYTLSGFNSTIPDYGYNEVISNYVYENGQCQESSRDQAHAIGGIATLCTMAEIAWNQGDDLYGHLNNRLLLGMDFWYRYNLSWVQSFPDQITPWEPTVENGEYIKRSDRSGRWTALKINPWLAQNTEAEDWHRGRTNLLVGPMLESNLGHYKYRIQLPYEDTKWLERGFEFLTNEVGVEQLTTTDLPGLGGLKYRRVSPGDPISGLDSNGLPLYKMNELPTTIEAENYDYFVLDGQDRTYNDISSSNEGGAYRNDEGVDLKVCSEGGFNLTEIADGEWLTYTVNVPADGTYDISIRYASANPNGKIKFSFSGEGITPEVTVPFGGAHSTGLTDWKDFKVGSELRLIKGVQQMKVLFSGANNAFELNTITVDLVEADPDPINLAVLHGTASQSVDSDPCPYGGCAELAIDGNTNGNFGGGSVSHSAHGTSGSLKWWKVDLQNNYNIETINIYNRTGGYQSRLSDLTVEIKNSNGTVVFNQFYSGYPNPLWTIDTGGVIGSVVTISKTTDTGITLAEVEVYGVNQVVTLSNDEFELNNTVKLYPNPANNLLNIANAQGSKVSIYSILGKEVLTTELKKTKATLDINHLKAGVYFVKIGIGNSYTTKKIIKQ